MALAYGVNRPIRNGIHVMNPVQSISSVFRQYFGFSGRASRSEYWWFFLFQFISMIVLSIAAPTVYWIYVIATFMPGLAVIIRRLHDTERSGWWVLIAFVPLLGSITLLVFASFEGDRRSNKYGPDLLLPPAVQTFGSAGGAGIPQSEATNCANCGSLLDSGGNFCRSCGTVS